jgi:uroporphyrinogen decarboxylase
VNDRERFLAVMSYRPVDRGVFGVWTGGWPETYDRWKGEGWSPDRPEQPPMDRWTWEGGWFFPNPPFERVVLEETAETVLYVNHEGITMRERTDNPMSSMPQFVRFPVEDRASLRKFLAERMRPDLAARIGADWAERLAALRHRDTPLVVVSDRWGGFFGGLRAMVGVERLCTLFYDDPALVEEMMDAVADFIVAMMGSILDLTDVDCYGFWEDMAYKTGPLVGPDLYRRFALPRYRRVVDFVRSRGVPHVCLDSDGAVHSLVPTWLDAGIDTLYPFERQAGMDVLEVRRRYGRDLRMWFGLDKRALVAGPAAIDAEVERVRPLLEEGGYVAGLDHSMPPDVPYANFRYYWRKLAETVGREAAG